MKITKNKSFICIVGISLSILPFITSCTPTHETEIAYDEDITSEINIDNEENYKLYNKIKTMN